MKIKKIVAAVLSLCIMGGAFTFNAPADFDFSITAEAAGTCYTFNETTGLLTLNGNVVLEEITGFEQKEAVKSIIAAEGTVLPESCGYLFGEYANCTSIDLSNVDTSSVTDMSFMFFDCNALTSLDLSSFDTSSVTNVCCMFRACNNLTSLDLSSFDTSSVMYMSGMFYACEALTSLDLSSFDTSSVTDLSDMFCYCEALNSIDISSFDTSSVTAMNGMFESCQALTSLDLSNFDTSSVTDMYSMFFNCKALTSLDLSSFDTSNVKNMHGLFCFCEELTSLDLSSFDTSSVTDVVNMFLDSPSLSMLKLSKDFGNVVEMHGLTNEGGWVNSNDPSTIISGTGKYAKIANSGTNTYIRNGGSVITEPPMMGDVNGDKTVNLNDAVAILQYVALSAKYPLDAQAQEVADVCDNGTSGINGQDALVIMMVDAGVISPDELPVTSKDLQ